MKILDHIQIYESKDDDGFIVLHPTKEDLVMKLNEIIDVLEEMRARQDIYARREELDRLISDTNTITTYIQHDLANVNESVESIRGAIDQAANSAEVAHSTASSAYYTHYDPATQVLSLNADALSLNAVNIISTAVDATNVSIARDIRDAWV